MDTYRPISKLNVADDDLDSLHAEVMPWMVSPLLNWLEPFLWHRDTPYGDRATETTFVDGLELALRLREPLKRSHRASASKDVTERIRQGGPFGLDVAGYALRWSSAESARALEWLLAEGGSAWEVTSAVLPGAKRKKRYLLARRDLQAARDAVAYIRSQSERAGQLLAESWVAVAGREADPNEAYDKAVKAVEAAAQPVVSPANERATLGTMVRDINMKPDKWRCALGEMELISDMATTLWSNHWRHGTQQRDDHTSQEADAALHLAITLTRFFVGRVVDVASSRN